MSEARPQPEGEELLSIVDASEGDWGPLPGANARRFAALTATSDLTGHAKPEEDGVAPLDPLNVVLHRLLAERPEGGADRRMSWATVNDFDGSADVNEESEAPFGQAEGWTAANRSTRERDIKGRTALPSSIRRIVDAEDGRHALALVCPSPDMGDVAPEIRPQAGDDTGRAWPEGVNVFEAGTNGGIYRASAGISIGGFSYMSGAAIGAARSARDAGGSIADMARAAGAAAAGRPPPPLLDADTQSTRTRPTVPAPTRTRTTTGPSWSQGDKAGGYVHDGKAIGLLGTIFKPSLQISPYFLGGEGTPIGPNVIRHDAQFGMPGSVGRIMFEPMDLSTVAPGNGKLFKGAMGFDPTRKNVNTEVGNETGQWRPYVYVDASIPPSEKKKAQEGGYVDVRPDANDKKDKNDPEREPEFREGTGGPGTGGRWRVPRHGRNGGTRGTPTPFNGGTPDADSEEEEELEAEFRDSTGIANEGDEGGSNDPSMYISSPTGNGPGTTSGTSAGSNCPCPSGAGPGVLSGLSDIGAAAGSENSVGGTSVRGGSGSDTVQLSSSPPGTQPRSAPPGGSGGTHLRSQVRDPSLVGAPCPNLTAGQEVNSSDPYGTFTGADGTIRDYVGHPAVVINADGSMSLGGVER